MSGKTKIAEALFPLLSAFHEVDGLTLKAVRQTQTENDLIGIDFDFEFKTLIIEVDGDDDTIELRYTDSSPDGRSAEADASFSFPWKSCIGKEFGWGWVAVNQQGYLDGILLSFAGITPQFLITAVASSLKISQIEQLRQIEPA